MLRRFGGDRAVVTFDGLLKTLLTAYGVAMGEAAESALTATGTSSTDLTAAPGLGPTTRETLTSLGGIFKQSTAAIQQVADHAMARNNAIGSKVKEVGEEASSCEAHRPCVLLTTWSVTAVLWPQAIEAIQAERAEQVRLHARVLAGTYGQEACDGDDEEEDDFECSEMDEARAEDYEIALSVSSTCGRPHAREAWIEHQADDDEEE